MEHIVVIMFFGFAALILVVGTALFGIESRLIQIHKDLEKVNQYGLELKRD